MSAPTIRPARKSDGDALAALWQELLTEQQALDPRINIADDALKRWRNDFPLWIDDSTRRMIVAEHEGRIVGYVHAHRWGPPPIFAASSEVYIDDLYVREEVRGTGIGSNLVQAILAWAEELQADRLRMGVLTKNTDGHAFWKAVGANPLYTTFTIEIENESKPEKSSERQRRIGF